MKKFLTFLPVLCLMSPAFGQPFEPQDKVLYFDSTTVQSAIEQHIPIDFQTMAAEQYVNLMDQDTGKVSVQDLKNICMNSNLSNDNCQKFIISLYNSNDTKVAPTNGISDSVAFIKRNGVISASYKSNCNGIKDPNARDFQILNRPTGANCWCTSTSQPNDYWHYMTTFKDTQQCHRLCNEECTKLYKGE